MIAIFTKFDDLITQVYDMDLEDDENRKAAEQALEEGFRVPLFAFADPPKASVYLECMHEFFFFLRERETTHLLFLALHENKGNHQDQVKELMKETAGSLDDLALKILFVSVQKNNLELCMEYAVK